MWKQKRTDNHSEPRFTKIHMHTTCLRPRPGCLTRSYCTVREVQGHGRHDIVPLYIDPPSRHIMGQGGRVIGVIYTHMGAWLDLIALLGKVKVKVIMTLYHYTCIHLLYTLQGGGGGHRHIIHRLVPDSICYCTVSEGQGHRCHDIVPLYMYTPSGYKGNGVGVVGGHRHIIIHMHVHAWLDLTVRLGTVKVTGIMMLNIYTCIHLCKHYKGADVHRHIVIHTFTFL